MTEETAQQLTYIPEVILKRRKTNEELALRRKEQLEQRKFKSQQNKQEYIKKPEAFIKEYRYREMDLVHMKHRLKRKRPALETANSQLLLVVRIQGYPNLKNVRELIYKKGFAKIDKKKVPLTDNNLIEQAMGQYDVICIEDVVHEIATIGPHFKEVTGFLWPIVLNKPEAGLKGSKTVYKDGGDAGDRGDKINELISKMN
ncbi:60S ribosomal protein L7-1-like isoform X2 [Pyrus x bretschneideri]|uniref:60S ribosomal protein L7-1-like isoform X2 n=1 Tax=Pyrus x bretschneideri TaxID=225117 RepID=UPI00202FE98E|nr:60S ribosomal protein L7-1-like isoform X2 [Pyrus x bretschneideri]